MKLKRLVLAGAAIVVALAVFGVLVALSGTKDATPATQELVANTERVQRGKLSAMVSLDGTLTYRARSDGSPYSVANQASGTFTELPDVGDKADCGDVLYRVNDAPVLLLCGVVPVYRNLRRGDAGNDVRQLNQNLHELGYDAGVGIEPGDNAFSVNTEKALEVLQYSEGYDVTGALAIGGAVFLPSSVRIAKVTAELGGAAQPGAPVLSTTSDMLEVQVDLAAAQQGEVHQGDRARITLPGNQSVAGRVDRLGSVARVPAGPNDEAGQNNNPGDATVPASITLDDPRTARGLDSAPVQVEITTGGVDNALSIPVTAIVGKSGGGFAVELVRDAGRRELVAVKLGLFDTAGGRVQVEGGLREGDHVVVPSL